MSSDWYNRTDLSLPAMGAWNMPPVIVGVGAFSISGRCPSCNSRLGYDAFEDMYTCHGCYEFFYPEEIAVMPNPASSYHFIGASQ